MTSTTLTGAELAGYRIEAVAGRGGMGVVYRAWHLGLERPVALKVISPDLASQEEFRARFQRESKLAAALDHPHVLPLYEAGEHDGVLFIAMRWVDGTDLGRLLADEAPAGLPVDRALGLVEHVAGALDAAHGRGLVHRDVKPANVLLATEGDAPEHAYLADFGLAKRDGTGGLTETGRWLGTADYAAPESIEGGEVGPPADVYALGCVLYTALTGRAPFERENPVAVAYAQIHDDPPRPTEVRPGLPPALDDVVARALAKRPRGRFGSATELASAARRAADGDGSAAATRPRHAWKLAPTAKQPVVNVEPDDLATRPLRAKDDPDELATRPLLGNDFGNAPEALSARPLVRVEDPAALATPPIGGGDRRDPPRPRAATPPKPRRRGRRVLAVLALLLLLVGATAGVALATGKIHLPSFVRAAVGELQVSRPNPSGPVVRCDGSSCHQGEDLVSAPATGSPCTRVGRPGSWTRLEAPGHEPMVACMLDESVGPLVAVRPAVPDLAGARLDLAEQLLDRSGIPYESQGGGLLGVVLPRNWTVCQTTPRPGTTLPTDVPVTLAVGHGC